jgi:hypothetical protein
MAEAQPHRPDGVQHAEPATGHDGIWQADVWTHIAFPYGGTVLHWQRGSPGLASVGAVGTGLEPTAAHPHEP